MVAGGGGLPVSVAAGLKEAGHAPFIVMIGGEADAKAAFESFDHAWLELEQLGHLLPLLRKNRVTHVVLAGGIGRRPSLSAFRPMLWLLRLLPKALPALRRGDDGLLRTLVDYVEANGVKVIGAHEILPELLADHGALTRATPTSADWADLEAGQRAALAIGALDIGQAAVAIGGRAVALEGIEGTDGLLERMISLRKNGRIANKTRGVLVKCAKPDQELRADLPAIGPATVEAAHAAGLAGIGVEAGRSLILDAANVFMRADALGLFVFGLDRRKPS